MGFRKESLIAIKDGFIYNKEELIYESDGVEVIVPPGEISDGVTLTWITKLFFTTREFLLGAEAAIIHDHMCKNKEEYDRRLSSKFLRDIWVSKGLNRIKGFLIYIFTDLYQFLLFRREWKS